MSIEQEVELIRRIPIFQRIQPAMQKLLCFGSERLTYDAGQALVRAGDPADAAYVIIEGTVEVSVDSPKGPLVIPFHRREFQQTMNGSGRPPCRL